LKNSVDDVQELILPVRFSENLETLARLSCTHINHHDDLSLKCQMRPTHELTAATQLIKRCFWFCKIIC